MIDTPRFYNTAQRIQSRLAKAGLRCALGVAIHGEWLVFTAIFEGGRRIDARVDLKEFMAVKSIRMVAELVAMEVQSAFAEDRN